MKTIYSVTIISIVLIGLFFFTGMEKIWYHEAFVIKLGRQPLPDWMKEMLRWGLPLAELATVGFLVAGGTRLLGFWTAAIMMSGFACYTAYASTEPTGHVPCACGKVFNRLTWGEHFWVNICFLGLAVAGIWFYHQAQKKNSKILRNRSSDHRASHEL